LDPLIKSQLLYQLSYEVIFASFKVDCFWLSSFVEVSLSIAMQRYGVFLNPPNVFEYFFKFISKNMSFCEFQNI
ncbi:MAG: hypothetical protein NC349_01830, partial [Paenibacillus sp.]|nr:hypothetical protein [Paenibacillus sp.]